MQTRKLTTLALYTCLALAVFAIESAIPPLVPIPGIKLGLANIITLLVLRQHTPKDAALVLTARILLSALLFGSFISLLYSAAGGFLSLFIMVCADRLFQKRYTCLTGALGGLIHNLGQLLIAFFITSTPGVFAYLPFLVFGGIFTGLFTGLCAALSARYLLPQLKHLS